MLWVFHNTRGSVLMAILVHASWNTFYSAVLIQLFPAPSVVLGSYLNLAIAAGALAVLLVALTKGHLGYRHTTSKKRNRSGYSPNLRRNVLESSL